MDVVPAAGASITSAEGHFFADVVGAMRQVNPFGLPTVLADNNSAMVAVGESPLADSQFEFKTHDAAFVIDTVESDTSLNAILAGIGPFASRFTLAHVVLKTGATGTWFISIAQSEGAGMSREYNLSGQFALNAGQLAGDYNGDHVVNAPDYVMWRDAIGSTGNGLAADGNGDQQIDADDYDVWRANFGRSAMTATFASGAITEPVTAVPEPATSMLSVVVMILTGTCKRRRMRC